MEETLEIVIGKSVPSFVERAFMVPDGVDLLGVEHDLPQEYGFLVFMVIRNPKGKVRFQKQLGCSEPMISLGSCAEDTTIGGVPGEIPSGKWHIDICLFSEYIQQFVRDSSLLFHITISDERLPVTEVIGGQIWTDGDAVYSRYDFARLFQTGRRWYKGDLHTHTRLSDGVELPYAASEKAEKMELDYYIPTEHNVIHTGWPITNVMIVPGVEVTTTLGHANLFGIDRRPKAMDAILCHKEDELLKEDICALIGECRERDWLFSINHPFLYIWKWLMEELNLEDINCLEIINDPTYAADKKANAKEANDKAVFLADALWEDGYRVCAIGGSDSHKRIDDFYEGATEPSVPGDPATWIYMDGMSPEHLKDALKKCHSYVTRYCKAEVELRSYCENKNEMETVLFGDRINPATVSLSYSLTLKDLLERPVIFYLQNGEKHICQVAETEYCTYRASGTITIEKNGYTWIRFGAEKEDGSFLFYGNPVTVGKKEHRFHTFGEIKNYVETAWKCRSKFRDNLPGNA